MFVFCRSSNSSRAQALKGVAAFHSPCASVFLPLHSTSIPVEVEVEVGGAARGGAQRLGRAAVAITTQSPFSPEKVECE